MNIAERALVFECEGEHLVSVIAEPEAIRKTGVLVIVGGWQYRAGSHRQFVLLARRLARRGIAAMRFDYRGMGDSSGGMRTFEDVGRDIAAAIDAFAEACPALERVVLWGLCDAASASLMYWHSSADARVAGMVMLNPWVLSEVTLARVQAKRHVQKRIFEGEFWKKLARGRIDIQGALKTFAAAARPREAPTETGDYQALMEEGLAKFAGPVLIVLSGRDTTAQGFLEYCGARPRWSALLGRANVEQHAIPEADHTFSSAAWREAVEAITLDWLERAFD